MLDSSGARGAKGLQTLSHGARLAHGILEPQHWRQTGARTGARILETGARILETGARILETGARAAPPARAAHARPPPAALARASIREVLQPSWGGSITASGAVRSFGKQVPPRLGRVLRMGCASAPQGCHDAPNVTHFALSKK
jgi:hypothetical protein